MVLLVAGLFAPAAAEPAPDLPATVAERLPGLPAAQRGGRVSRPIQAPIPFSMVGFDVPEGATLQFRTSVDGRAWGPWTDTEVEPEEGPDPTSPEGQAARRNVTLPVWVGEAGHLQTRLQGPRGVARPEKAQAHLIDSSGLGRSWAERVADRFSAAWRGTPPAAHAMAGRPEIIRRSQWGANESLRRSGPSYAKTIEMGFVHHTVNSNSYTRAQSDNLVRGIYEYHVRSNGWSDIGYNFLVDRYGQIFEGRYGGVTKPVIGAHAGGFNTATFGAALIGSFGSKRPPKAMRRGLRRLLAWKYDIHHVNVLGSTDYTSYGSTRHASGTTVKMRRLSGHRDASTTACPGAKTYDMLPNFRRSVAEMQGPVILHPQVSPTTVEVIGGKSVSGAVRFRARLRPAGIWKLRIIDSAGTIVHTTTSSGDRVSYDWTPVGLQPGTYRYILGGPDRRPVRGRLTVRPPQLSGGVTPTTVTYGSDGMLPQPLTFTGDLYDNAAWGLYVRDPDGKVVWQRTGTGATMTRSWSGPFTQPGRYSWELTAPEATPASGRFRVYADHVQRAGGARNSASAAAAVSRRTFPAAGATRAVVVSTAAPGYALAAAGLAGKDGPILYTHPDKLPERTIRELRRSLRVDAPVYVFGRPSVISDAVFQRLQLELAPRLVQRVGGKNPQTVAASASQLVVARSGSTSAVVVGTGAAGTWRQSVAAGAYAASHEMPVLITNRDTLSAPAAAAIARDGITSTIIVGNSDSVSGHVRDQLPSSRRIAGSTGPRTAVAVAKKLFVRTAAAPGDSYLFVNAARSDGWVRSLAAAPLAARTRGPVLLSSRTSVTTATNDYLTALGYRRTVLGRGVVLGNTEHVSSTTETTLARLLQ